MTINLNVPATHELKPRITVFGVGGAGGNAVNNMITSHLEGVEFVVANTDAQSLAQSLTERRIQLGTTLTQGLGSGARPDVGRQAAEEALDAIQDHLQGANMVFITCGMGGGTGTGAAPVMARVAREAGILTVGVATKPFHFEGKQRMRIAESGIDELQQVVDTLIVIPNQNLFRVANEKTTFADAFKMADDVLYSGVRGVTDLMVMPGLINLDFADVRTVMMEMGKAMMGTGEAEGEQRSLDAAEASINNPLLDDVSLKGARGVLVNITGGPDMTLFEVDEACNHIRDQVDVDANIIFGSTFDEQLAGRIRVSVVATGIDDGESSVGALAGAERISAGRTASVAVAADAPPPMTAQEPAVAPAAAAEAAMAEASEPRMPSDRHPAEPAVPVEPVAGGEAEMSRRQAEPDLPPVQEANPLLSTQSLPRIEPTSTGRRATDREPSETPQPSFEWSATAAPEEQAVPAAPQEARADSAGRPRLFEWMRRGTRSQEPAAAESPQPVPAQSPPSTEPERQHVDEPVLEPAGEAALTQATVDTQAPQAVAERRPSPDRKEDLLDIPAFLRRQSS